MNRMRTILSVAVVLGARATALGHEFWIEPSTWRPASGSVVRVSLMHGERFLGDSVPRVAGSIERFELADESGVVAVRGRDGATTSFARPAGPGIGVIGYLSREQSNNLAADAFEAYLEEEGLGVIAELRAARGQSDEAGREAYTRCAKALIRVGNGGDGYDRRLGLPLELVPEANPFDRATGTELPVRLLWMGKPLADAEVVAVRRDAPHELMRMRTDNEGRVSVRLTGPGPWMLTSIHMVEADADDAADWASSWASITFDIAP